MPLARKDFVGKRPYFFKIFFPYITAKRLGIPRAFLKHIASQAGYVGLTGPSGNVWNVKLVRTADGGMSFQNGWQEFVADHDLGLGDFLVFRYDSDMNFSVLIFDQTSCEKEDTFYVSPCHEFKIQVDNRPRKHAREGSVNKSAVPIDSDTNRAVGPTCKASLKDKNALIHSRVEERPQVADGMSVGKRGEVLEHQHRSSSPMNVEPETVEVPAGSSRCCKDSCTENRGFIGSQASDSDHSSMKKVPSSAEHALQVREQFLCGHSDLLACCVHEPTQNEQDKCRQEFGAFMPIPIGKSKTEAAGRDAFGKSSYLYTKYKRLAVKRYIQKKRMISHRRGALKQFLDEPSRPLSSTNVENVLAIKLGSRSKIKPCMPITAEHGKSRALEAALHFQSKHPFCCRIMRDTFVGHRFFMYLPKSFICHLPRHSTEMKLRNPDNKIWHVTYKYSNNGGALSAGWSKFARGNCLEKGDVCVFELIKPLEIRIFIFRVVNRITHIEEEGL